jgi:hypothetical protein
VVDRILEHPLAARGAREVVTSERPRAVVLRCPTTSDLADAGGSSGLRTAAASAGGSRMAQARAHTSHRAGLSPATSPRLDRAQVLAPQRAAGNAATVRLLRQRGAIGLKPSESAARPEAESVGRALPRRIVQRVPSVGLPVFPPSYNPTAARAWTSIGRDEGGTDCTPFGEVSAYVEWESVRDEIDFILEGGVYMASGYSHSLNCPDVHSAFHAYLTGTGRPNFYWHEPDDSTGCVLQSLKNDRVHHPAVEDPIMRRIQTGHLDELIAHAGTPVPLSTLGVSEDQLGLDLAVNDQPYGLLFGGVGDGIRWDSEYGPDLRKLTGTVTATIDPSAPFAACGTQYILRFDFDWYLKDALDFCPGNTEYGFNDFVHDHGRLGDMSRLEASGMARDIKLEARYRRPRIVQVCRPAPPPVPRCTPVVLHEDVFHFPFGASVPDTPDSAVYTELERTFGGRGLPQLDHSLTALNVVGHTDSHGEGEFNRPSQHSISRRLRWAGRRGGQRFR